MFNGLFGNLNSKNKKNYKLATFLEIASKSSDFTCFYPSSSKDKVIIYYYYSLIDSELFKRDLLPYLKPNLDKIKSLQDISDIIPVETMLISDSVQEIETKLNHGFIFIQLHKKDEKGLLIDLKSVGKGYRETNDTENEFSVIGPKVGFVENLSTNIFLLKQLLNTNLMVEELKVGSISKTKVAIVYLEGITNPEYVNTARQRLKDTDFDVVFDTSIIDQMLSDNSTTPFPVLLTTERVDRVVYALTMGQVAIISDGSPYILTGPSAFLDFFISPEDYYLPWIVGTFFRMIRIIGVLFSIFSTPIYVAILTFHYEVIPQDLLRPLISSRAYVPFPPVLEAIFLEITIEFLREAGARLPTKIGQTLGIVGGIVIGQASVEAALTSNILLIVVALSALASFTTPIFKMSNTIRLIRFPFIVLAATWGGFGIVIGFVIMLTHLLGLKSLGNPYLVPLFPFRIRDYADSIVRSNFEQTTKRASYLRPLKMIRYRPKKNRDVKEGLDHE